MKKKVCLGLVSLMLAAVFAVVFAGCGTDSILGGASSQGTNLADTAAGEKAKIYYLDVGQADSQWIELPSGETILIDAGDRGTSEELTQYLQDMGVTKIDILIATHPHADHIGGMANVVKNFEIGKIYMPKVADSQIPTTKTYENLLTAISEKNLKMTAAKGGMTVLDQDGVKVEFLAPNSEKYKELNSYSIVTKLTYGNTSFLFTGDAESDSEQEMIQKGYDLRCNVLKLGHHGSSTSTSKAFFQAANPDYAIISCGLDNDYGHPHQETLQLLKKYNTTTYRTDEQGTILAVSDGKTVQMQAGLPSVEP